jgi:hypothetical protein
MAVYRYTGNDTLQWYPNPDIASSWDPNWGTFKKIDCKGYRKGQDLASKYVFKRTNESNPNCCGGNGGGPHELICPEGSFVKEFYGASGSLIDRIGVKCSNNSDLGSHGGKGGSPFSVVSDDGFNKLQVKSGALVDNIKFFANNVEKGARGGGGGDPHELNCDGKIMGLKVRSGDLLDRIGVVCGKFM